MHAACSHVRSLLVLLVVLGSWAGAFAATKERETVITEAGKPRMSLAVGTQCSRPSRFAADELQRYLREISGAACPITHEGEGHGLIAVGPPAENPATARLLEQAGVDFGALDLGDDGFVLRTVGRNIVVAGATGRATLYAAYALLERIGCRWCFPGEHGEVIPKQPTIGLPALNVVEKPAFNYRTFMQHAAVSEETADWIDWMAKNRMNRFLATLYAAKGYKGQLYSEFRRTPGLLDAFAKRGMLIEAGHHASYFWIPPEQFYATKPEFFAEVDGKRGPVAIKGPRAQLCFSNAELAEVTAERIIAFCRENPEADILSLYTNDGYGYCECAACKVLGSKTDAYIAYVNRVAEAVHKALPAKRLSFLSYSHVSAPPAARVFGRNTLCAIATWPPPDARRLKGWLASGAGQVALYEYYMGSYSDRSIPWAATSAIAKELKAIHKLGLAGVASQGELRSWGSYGLNYWVFARMIWDPTQPLDAVLADYFGHYYAEAAEPMRAYFACLEGLGRLPRDLDVPEAKIQRLDGLLQAGEKAAATDAVRARIGRDRVALDYLKLAWAMKHGHRQATALLQEGKPKEAEAAFRRAIDAGKACLAHLHRHADERVFLMGRRDKPHEIVGYFYTTSHYEKCVAKLEEELAGCRRAADQPVTHRNLALRKKARAQSAYAKGFTADKAVDGNPATAWWSGYHRSDPATAVHKVPQWHEVDLGAIQRIAAVTLKTPRQVYRYHIDVSADGKAWTRVVEKKDGSRGNPAPGVSHVFAAVDARYVRTTVTDNAKGAGHICEIEVFGEPGEGQRRAMEQKQIDEAAARVKAVFHAHIRERARSLPEKRIGDAFPGTRQEWLAHSSTVRRQLRSIFHFPEADVPLDARTVGTLDRGDFVIEKVVYRVEPDNWATANLYVPKGVAAPAPAFILPCGHGGSKSAPYNQYFGQMYAKAGCVVLAPDPIGEEERDERCRLGIRGHRLDHRIDRCIALGTSTIGKMVYDITRGVDYLLSRREVDPKRIGCAGHSLGGTVTEYATAVDPRIALSFPTAWTCNFAEIVGDPSCCWRPVGLLRVANDPELYALGAPHCATLVLAGGSDACPMHVSLFERTTIARAKRVYELFGRGDCLAVHTTPKAGHQPFQVNRAALAWVAKHFGLPRLSPQQIAKLDEAPSRENLLAELPVPFKDKSWSAERLFAAKAVGGFGVRLLPFETLRCLKPGDEARPEYGMKGWFEAREQRLAARFVVPKDKAALDKRRAELKQQARSLLNLPDSGKPAAAETLRTFRHGAAEVHELKYGRLGLSSYFISPEGVAHAPVAIYLHGSRTKEGALASPRVGKLLAGGTAVLALDSVPFEETTHLLGTTPTAYNVAHVLESLDVIGTLGDVDTKRIACIGEVDDVAALAALLDERIASVVVASTGDVRVPRQGYRWTGVVPGLRAVASRAELVAMLAPRRVCLEVGIGEAAKIAAVYGLLGAAEQLELHAR